MRVPEDLKFASEHALVTIAVTFVVRLGLYLNHDFVPKTLFTEFLTDLAILAVVSVVVFIFMIGRIAQMIFPIIEIHAHAERSVRQQITSFVTKNLERQSRLLANVRSEAGASMDSNDANDLTQLCFEFGKSRYDGTDSHVPSDFQRLYPQYLSSHQNNLQKMGNAPGTRILIASEEDLVADFRSNRSLFLDFLLWHVTNNVELLRVEPAQAKAIALKHNIPDGSTDFGVWYDNYTLIFTPEEGGKVRMRMRFANEPDYAACASHFNDLRLVAKKISLNDLPLDESLEERRLFVAELTGQWERFVECDKRIVSEGPFLDAVLPAPGDDLLVVDAAAGIGCESIYLSKKGYNVISNEIDAGLAALAVRKAEENHVHLRLTQWNWRQMASSFTEKYGKLADVVLVLGNSLCLLKKPEDRVKCIEQFARMLKPGGLLVIDERNFPYILDNKKRLMDNPPVNFRFKKTVMYCGTKVQGAPIAITRDSVKFRYYLTDLGWESGICGYLEMYPFKKNEMRELLEKAGFSTVSVYSDLVEGYDESADFFTYVAVKDEAQRGKVTFVHPTAM